MIDENGAMAIGEQCEVRLRESDVDRAQLPARLEIPPQDLGPPPIQIRVHRRRELSVPAYPHVRYRKLVTGQPQIQLTVLQVEHCDRFVRRPQHGGREVRRRRDVVGEIEVIADPRALLTVRQVPDRQRLRVGGRDELPVRRDRQPRLCQIVARAEFADDLTILLVEDKVRSALGANDNACVIRRKARIAARHLNRVGGFTPNRPAISDVNQSQLLSADNKSEIH